MSHEQRQIFERGFIAKLLGKIQWTRRLDRPMVWVMIITLFILSEGAREEEESEMCLIHCVCFVCCTPA